MKKFPQLVAENGHGFDHEVLDKEGQLVCRVYGDARGWEIAALFVAAPRLYYIVKQIDLLLSNYPTTQLAATGLAAEIHDALEIAEGVHHVQL